MFPQKMVSVTGMPEPPYRMAGWSKKMAAENTYTFLRPSVHIHDLDVNGVKMLGCTNPKIREANPKTTACNTGLSE
jgi:hypothetical protein